MRFDRIPESAFQNLQLGAGILLRKFDPTTLNLELADILYATTGGINFKAVPTFSDFGEDIDNCPKNMKELKELESWDIKMSGTAVTVTRESIKALIGAADIDDNDMAKITPRNDLKDSDFADLWWVGDYSDENGDTTGGAMAIHMMESLSTAGFQIQTTDRKKGTFPFEYTAHYSIKEQEKVPFEVYIKAGTANPSEAVASAVEE